MPSPDDPAGAIRDDVRTPPLLDHVVVAAPDLEATVARFARATGVRPAPGGRHPGRGTVNYLVSFSDASYLELIGPDPLRPPEADRLPFGLSTAPGPRVATWAVHPEPLESAVERARGAGFDPGPVRPGARTTPEGVDVRWCLTDPLTDPTGVLPFLIGWGDTPTPALSAPRVTLEAVTATAKDPNRVTAVLEAIGTRLPLATGPGGLRLVVRGPAGTISF